MRVLISGAGIAGPALAWFLAKTGAHIDIVEKSSTLRSNGHAVDFKGPAATVIRKMGLLDEIKGARTTEKGTHFVRNDGVPFATFPAKEGTWGGQSASLTSNMEILRGDLVAILYNATKIFSNVDYHFDTTVKNVISNDTDSVKVELSNGEVREYEVLVAADGQWSRLRKQCFPSDGVHVIDMGMYAAYWTVPRLKTDNDWWNIYVALGSRLLSIRPDPHGTMRALVTHMPSNEDQKKRWIEASRNGRQSQEQLLRREFSEAGWQAQRILNDLDQAPDLYFQAIQQIKMVKWSTSRIVCLGDTAYAPTPLTGMGTSLAMIGAYILAGELSKLQADESPSKALEAYEAILRSYVEKEQNIPSFIPGIAHPGTTWKRWLLETFLLVLSKVVALPWVAGRVDEGDKDRFAWPPYPKLDDKIPE
jgi:2-polyprenyl-6-methoxyphenol hydroxylase-like FAD-dependent oxidoreductase